MRNPVFVGALLEVLDSSSGSLTRKLLFSGYNESYRTLRGLMLGNASKRGRTPDAARSFSNLLFRLKQDGLVDVDNGRTVRLTEKGKGWLKRMRPFLSLSVPPARQKDHLKIVIFDIPEREKKKRRWLRNMLALCGYTMLQKSVWIGDQKLPADFVRHLRDLDISSFVHIFAVTRKGTLD